MRKSLCILLLTMTLLCGCGKKQEDVPAPTAPTADTSTQQTQPSTAPATEPVSQKDRNPLTGEAVDQPVTNRPYAVMFNNVKPALPQCGVGEADWLFEVVVEGGVTRCMGLFTSLPKNGDLGSIRSARPYYVSLAKGYDAIYVHAGGSDDAYKDLSASNQDHIDGVNGPNAGAWFYRNQDRLNAGVALEHTMFISSQGVLDYAKERNCTLARQEPVSFGLSFDPDGTPAGKDANTVTVWFRSEGKTTTFHYDAAPGLYSAEEFGSDYIDGNTGETLQFRNILVLQAKTETHANGVHQIIDLLGSGEGSFICGGKCVDILWSRKTENDPFTLTQKDGTPLVLGEGKSYVGIVPAGSPLDLEG